MEQIVILDFGSQYTQVIARRVRELNVYSTILRYDTPASEIQKLGVKGIILSGSHASVYDVDDRAPEAVFELGIPVLGICYGAQWLAAHRGGSVARSVIREYGRAVLQVQGSVGSPLLEGLSEASQVWMSHGDAVTQAPAGFTICAVTADIA